MILRGARVAVSATRFERLDVSIHGAKIVKLGAVGGGDRIDLSGHVILPGLINAHDHLEFNLFPRLGRGPWPNATEWARDVYRPDESPVKDHRRVPRRVRLYWGGMKNLMSGATTVCHHNPYESRVFGCRFPVRVVRDFGWAHSLAFSPDTAARFRSTPGDWPFVIHAGESTDGSGSSEIRELKAMGALGSRTVLVHAVDIRQRELRRAETKVITCPSSNLFNLGTTLPQSLFHNGVPIALGTDSAITARTDLLDELRVARRLWELSPASLYRMVTETAASILRLTDGRGEIRERGTADLIVLRDRGESPCETLLATRRIEIAIVEGRIRLASARFAPNGFERLSVAGRGTVFVDAKIGALYRAAASIVGEPLRLAGKRVRI
ncbi:MAG TPA: amidohydrolase family protein [Bryobacteraceae bacterium]|jgi:cytosine/adenosine deaminase-related metal-dependent hydrolase|nr:amidohydrolase family protein [Bryobacteraceae bacterium]